MFNLISYRPTFCRNGRLSPSGEGLLQIECRQQKKTVYFSACVKVRPEQFIRGQVVNHPIANELNLRLRQMIWDLMAVEMDCVKRGIQPSLSSLKEAWREYTRPSAKLVDFAREMLNNSTTRREATRRSYSTLFNSLEKFRPGTLIQDVDYSFVCKYDAWLKLHGSGHNTRVCRLRLLRTIMIEAAKRKIIEESPFSRYKIPAMINKRGFLSQDLLQKIERLRFVGSQAKIRDIFLLACYTGLRFSDIATLRNENLVKGWIVKKMVKTQIEVRIPIRDVFDGKAEELFKRYGSVNALCSNVGSNATVNKHLKEIFTLVKCNDKGYSFHTARHTFASLLMQQGVGISTIQRLLGHSSVTTTQIYAEVTPEVIQEDLRKTVKRKKVRVVNSE